MGKDPAPTRSPDPAQLADRVKLSDRGADLNHVDVTHVQTVPPRSA
jgi:hypothetical protein